MLTCVLEREAAPGGEVPHGRRHKDLRWSGLCGDAGAEVDGNSVDAGTVAFDLAGVNARSDLEFEWAE